METSYTAPTADYHQSAWDKASALYSGNISLKEIRRHLAGLGEAALEKRLNRLAAQWGTLSMTENTARLEAIFDAMATKAGSLEAFDELVSKELGGFVITAHPTFSLSKQATDKARTVLQQILDSKKPNSKKLGSNKSDLWLQPEASPSLREEGAAASEAVLNIRLAIRRMTGVFYKSAVKNFEADAYNLVPGFMTVASWVGFDLDGRTDIGWAESLHFRYEMAVAGVSSLQSLWSDVAANHSDENYRAVSDGLAVFARSFELGLEKLNQVMDHDDHAAGLAELNRLVVGRRAAKEKAMGQVDHALNALLSANLPDAFSASVAVFRAEWVSLGLGQSHIHFRLNAVQLHNAIKPMIEMDQAPDRSASRRHYLGAVSKLLDTVKPVNVHYGTLDREQTTAGRLFMLAAQFEKHFDGRTPIRLLVAESDTPFTLLAALYYARLFDVDDHVEISPLFETGIGLQRGDRVIAELIDNPHFLAYIKKQGRFCVQLGFSDSGRYIGQPAANLAIERFKLRLVKLWKKRGLEDVQLLFFDTHGESIGRGSHPGGLRKRFTYTHTPAVRDALSSLSAPYKHEVSFQGGDGYLWFLGVDSAYATLTDFLDTRLAWKRGPDDPFYARSNWSLDFFLTLKEYQDHLLEHPGYVKLLDSFGPRFLYATGSRAARRQGIGVKIDRLTSVNQVRAIPNNAMLQQLGYMANTVSGFGAGIELAPEIFKQLEKSSNRLKMLTSLVTAAAKSSDIHVLAGYAQVLDPEFWLQRSENETAPKLRENLRILSKTLEDISDFKDVSAVVRKLRRDAGYFKDHMNGACVMNADLRDLHQLRLALVQFIYLKATDIPRFSSRQDVSLDDLLASLLHMDVPASVKLLREIFPIGETTRPNEEFGETATFTGGSDKGYAREHAEIFDPIEDAYALILELSALIATEIGAFG